MRRRLEAAVGLVFFRFFVGRQKSSSRRRSSSSASRLLRCWLRSCWLVTTRPVGRWRRRTALSVLLACCPPLPPERNVSTSHSERRASSVLGGRGIGRLVLRNVLVGNEPVLDPLERAEDE